MLLSARKLPANANRSRHSISEELYHTIWNGILGGASRDDVWPGREPNAPINNPQKCFNAALRRAEIKGCRIHDLRHTYASTLVNAGATLFEVQKALGHASSQITQRYSHLTDNTLRDRAELAGQRLTGTHG